MSATEYATRSVTKHARVALGLALSVALSVAASGAEAQVGSRGEVPVPLPERPFLLLDAPRRFLPSEPARARVQLRDGGRAELALFAIASPDLLLDQAGRRQGVSLRGGDLASEAERLLRAPGALPRRGGRLTLVRAEALVMPWPEGPRRVWREATVFDSNEEVEENVATYWVRSERWSVREVDLGRLRPGVYLVQVRAAAWVASALVSVGDLVLIARRGDAHDVAFVSDANGAPQAGVLVRASVEGRLLGQARTDASGEARLPATGTASVRFTATRGADLAWSDVSHVRLAACDPRVYVATGRPLYREGETVHVRGHVRGCDEQGRFVPLRGETVSLAAGSSAEVRTDDDGNFVAEVQAQYAITATLAGRDHVRTLRIDARELPRRALVVSPDRPFAQAGSVIEVQVADADGGWPRAADVVLDTPLGRLVSSVGPGSPARFFVQVPSTRSAAERMVLHASLSAPGVVTLASAEVWIGRSAVQLEITADRARVEPGRAYPIEVRASTLGGELVAGPVALEVFGSDGNEAVGAPRQRAEVVLDAAGVARERLALSGAGPWLIRARRGLAEGRLVVWERERPPALSARGPLAITPVQSRARPGEVLELDLRLPPGPGRAWLTLEQGSVLVSRPLALVGRYAREPLTVPEGARGLASVILTHIEAGRVRTASATVEVETSRPLTLSVSTPRSIHAKGERARVSITARDDEGRPRDAVVSLWLADAGYWELGEDDYPLPGAYLSLPGRPSSGGDSSAPVAYGAEEGRVLDSELRWDGRALPGASHRHGWGYGGEVVDVSERGSLERVLGALARRAGFAGVRVSCPDAEGPRRALVARGLPWDLVAMRLGEALGANVDVDHDHLRFDCSGGSGFGAGGLGGRGAGMSVRGCGAGTVLRREERLEGTLHFVGLRRLGADGRLELEVPLPDHPGRWRVEVLAIADDGGGARAHRVVHTRDALEAWVEVPRALRVGDTSEGWVHVFAPLGAAAQLAVALPPELEWVAAPASRVALDAQGSGRARFVVRARSAGAAPLVTTARLDSGAEDVVESALEVLPGWTERDLRYHALVGPGAHAIEVPLPELAAPTTMTIELDDSVRRQGTRVLDELRRPRWHSASLRIDRLASLAALRRALPPSDGAGMLLAAEVEAAYASELHALSALRTSTGLLAEWSGPGDLGLTLRLLVELDADERRALFGGLVEDLERRVARGGLGGGGDARAAYVLAVSGRPVSATLLEGALASSGDDLELLRLVALAARAAGAGVSAVERRARERLASAVAGRLRSPRDEAVCRGFWLTCLARHGDRGHMARAATALVRAGHPDGRSLALRVAEWLAHQPLVESPAAWGSADADVLELVGLLGSTSPTTSPTTPTTISATRSASESMIIRLDGRPIAASRGTFVIPAGAHRVQVELPARAGRLASMAFGARLHVAPPATAMGNVALTRRFSREDGQWRAHVGFSLPRALDAVDLTVPLPAGLTADVRGLETGAEIVEGALRLRRSRMAAGAHEITVPLLELGAGTFTAGPAVLVGADRERWGMTTAAQLELRSPP